MIRDATSTRALRLTAAPCRGLLLACVLLPGLAAAAAAPGAAAKIDLDAFEAMKKGVALPDGERLAYLTMGDPAGTPVVLIHGYTDSARDWVPLIPHLSPHLKLILVDLRGHGRSAKPECCYTRFDFAYDVKLLLDALHIGRADVVGHSLGSIVAQTFAEVWPERTGRVVLISSTGGRRPGAAPQPPKFDYAAAIRGLEEPIDPDSKFMIEWWSSPTPVDPDFLRRQRHDAAAIPLRVWLAILDQGLSDADLQRTLPQLRAPTLLIWGSADPLMEEEVRQTLRAALPQAEVKIFPGLGHNPFWEEPAQCAAVINSFLQ
ncbi:MAG TPA: alpha/beta hydrolase [Steroidobacteraceae bacterium]|nr:alpha/beta hydrolase [Steroidobacteraceae bacterium]